MREIKFRAWGNEFDRTIPEYQMYRVTGINMTITGSEIYRIGVNRPMSKYPAYLADDYKLMQYTGLKDKNGVEIYEGDIVSVPGFIGKVIYSPGKFMFEMDDESVASMTMYPKDEVEVIGNIYENPELLK